MASPLTRSRKRDSASSTSTLAPADAIAPANAAADDTAADDNQVVIGVQSPSPLWETGIKHRRTETTNVQDAVRQGRPSVALRNSSTKGALEHITLGLKSPAVAPWRSTTTPPASRIRSRPVARSQGDSE